MLIVAFCLLGVAVLGGTLLAVLHLRSQGTPPRMVGGLHAALALGGFACLLFALGGPPRGANAGTASFGMIAAVMLALAALFGATIFTLQWFGRRRLGTLIAIHATLAIGGFVILAAYLFAG